MGIRKNFWITYKEHHVTERQRQFNEMLLTRLVRCESWKCIDPPFHDETININELHEREAIEDVVRQVENMDLSHLGNTIIDMQGEIQRINHELSKRFASIPTRNTFRKGREHSESLISEVKYCQVDLSSSFMKVDNEFVSDTHKLYKALGLSIPDDMDADGIEIAKLGHPRIKERLYPEKITDSGDYSPQIVLDDRDQYTEKLAFTLADSDKAADLILSSIINRESQKTFMDSHEISTYQSLVLIQRLFRADSTYSAGAISTLSTLVKENDKISKFFDGNLMAKVERVIYALKIIDRQLGTHTADFIFQNCFNLGILKDCVSTISSLEIYDWFTQNWRNLDVSYPDYQKFSYILMNPKGLSPDVPYHKMRWLFLTLDQNQKDSLTTLVDNLESLKKILKIGSSFRNRWPLAKPFDPLKGGSIKSVYMLALNEYTSQKSNGKTINVFPNNRWWDTYPTNSSRFHALRPYEVEAIEQLTQFLVNTLCGGDLGKYNSLHRAISQNRMPNSFKPLYESEKLQDFVGIDYLDAMNCKKYIGSRLDHINLKYDRVNEFGEVVTYDLERDSIDEGIAIFRNLFFVDDDSNVNFVNPSIGGDTYMLIGSENIRYRMMHNKEFQFKREILAEEKSYFSKKRKDPKKRIVGDIINVVGGQYGKDVFKSFYVENAGMQKISYLIKKPNDIVGLRQQRVPTSIIVPDGTLGRKASGLLRATKDSLITKDTTYVEHYQSRIQAKNEFSPIFDHKTYAALSKIRLKVQILGIKFESYRIFLDALRQPFFCNILNIDPVDARAIVETYGINYETGAYLGDVGLKCTIAKYWEDFDASTTYSENKRWSRLVFDILLKVLYETSGQVQLLMTPDQVQADYPGLVTADGSAFLDPATGTPMELFNYFDPEFARRFFKAGTWQERHGKGRTFHSVTDIMAHALSQFHLHHP